MPNNTLFMVFCNNNKKTYIVYYLTGFAFAGSYIAGGRQTAGVITLNMKMNKKTITAILTIVGAVLALLFRQCGGGGVDGTAPTVDTLDVTRIDTAVVVIDDVTTLPPARVIRDTVIINKVRYKTRTVNDTVLQVRDRIVTTRDPETLRLRLLVDSLQRVTGQAPVVQVEQEIKEYAGQQTADSVTILFKHLITGELLESEYRVHFPARQRTITKTLPARRAPFSAMVYGMNPTNEIAPAAGVGLAWNRYNVLYDYTHTWRMHRVGVGYRIIGR